MSQAGVINEGSGPSGPVDTLTGNTGGSVSPTASNINTLGTGSITIAGNPGTSTLTTQLTGLTIHNVLIGAGTPTITNVAPGTAGIPLVSNGATSDPSFTTALVVGGGTGSTSFNINGAVYSNTTTTGALQAATLTSGQLLIGGTSTPAAATLTAGSGISISNGNNSITISSTGITTLAYTSVSHSASPYTVLSTDDYLGCQTSTGTITLLLPNAPATGRVYNIKDSNGAAVTSNITVTTVGGSVTIDGATSYVIATNYQAINVIFNGTSYEVF